ncbi:hypothetical protein BDV97DRAFT_402210 [Delphinella strobiligena]|nr:hypothetical protein BDV97DRAFT_402210 [Delphinella strobiligena]
MDNHREQLHVAVDYGTAVVSVAAWICKAGERPSWVCDIPLTHGNTSKRTAPQIIAWHDGKLCWGQELRDAVENRSVPEEKVIHRAKLFVYEQYRHTSWGNRIREQLEEAVMLDYQLIGLHLKAMIALVRPWLYNNTPEGLSLSLSDLGSMKTELLLLVPACWSSSGTGTMTAAAKVAGVDRCQIVTELRVSMYSVNKDNFRRITEPVTVLHADGGDGTLDCVTVDIRPFQPELNDNPVFQTPDTDLLACLAGAELVDDNCVRYVFGPHNDGDARCPKIEAEGGIENFLQARNTTRSRFEAALLEQFKSIKEGFRPHVRHYRPIWLDFAEAEGSKQVVSIPLSADLIYSFFEPLIQAWIETLRSACIANPEAIVLASGFSHSELLQEALKAEFEPAIKIIAPSQIYAIAKPQLSATVERLFTCVVPMPMPKGISWGLVSHEKFDSRYHEHCYVPYEGRRSRNKNPELHAATIITERENGKLVTYAADCIDWLVTTGDPSLGHIPKPAVKTLVHLIRGDFEFLEVYVVQTSRALRQHEALWDKKGLLRDELGPLDPVPQFLLPDLARLGYASFVDGDGVTWYVDVLIETELVVTSGHVSLKLTVHPFPTGSISRKGKGRSMRARNTEVRDGWTEEQVIWSEWMANIVRDPQQGFELPQNLTGLGHRRQRRLVNKSVARAQGTEE